MQDVIRPDWLARIKTLGSIVPELCQRNAIISIKLLYVPPHDFYTGDITLVADQITATGANIVYHYPDPEL